MDDSRAVLAGSSVHTAERVSAFLTKVYGWMCIGLGITAVVAFLVASSPALVRSLVSKGIDAIAVCFLFSFLDFVPMENLSRIGS